MRHGEGVGVLTGCVYRVWGSCNCMFVGGQLPGWVGVVWQWVTWVVGYFRWFVGHRL